MYTPAAFAITDRAILHDIIAAHPLALLATNGPDGPVATQLPLMIETGEDGIDRIIGHFARGNPQWRDAQGQPALAVFRGPQGYVAPEWYATKRETGQVVPTWNYVTVQARGRLDPIHEPEDARAIIERLTDAMEATRPVPWSTADAPGRFIEAMMRGVVAFRMEIGALSGQAKLSQNKGAADRAGVRKGLDAEPGGLALLDAMNRWA